MVTTRNNEPQQIINRFCNFHRKKIDMGYLNNKVNRETELYLCDVALSHYIIQFLKDCGNLLVVGEIVLAQKKTF